MNRKAPLLGLIAFLAAVLALADNTRAQDDACSTAVAAAAEINASALFDGAVACSKEERLEDTHFLLILGQIRAMTDLTILEPLEGADVDKAGALYMKIYYQFGGLGSPDFYRTAANVDALEERIRATDLPFFDTYHPGWTFNPSSKTDIYAQYLANLRENRIWQMRNNALRWQNDEYFELSQALTELQRENPTFQAGTPAYDEHLRLMERMSEVEKGIPQLPEPENTVPYARLNEQDADMAERQVAIGFNGPAMQDTYVFRSEAEVRESWLSEALTDEEIETLLSKVDFSSQTLVGFAFGERMNASDQVTIAELGFSEGRGYSIATRIGVVPDTCGIEFTESYPFVLGVVDAVSQSGVNAQSTSNFPAECVPIMAGTPVTQN